MAWQQQLVLFACIVQCAAYYNNSSSTTAVMKTRPEENSTSTPSAVPSSSSTASPTPDLKKTENNTVPTTAVSSTFTVSTALVTTTRFPTSSNKPTTQHVKPPLNTHIIAGSVAGAVVLVIVTVTYVCYRSRKYNSFWLPRGKDSEMGMTEMNRRDGDRMSSASSESSVYSPAEIAEIAARANELDLSRKALHTDTDSVKGDCETASVGDGEDGQSNDRKDIVENGTDNGSSDATTHLIEQEPEIDGGPDHP